MADTKLSALTAATPAAGDLVYLVQGGNSRRATAQGIANLAPATNLAYEATTRVLSSSTGDDVTLPLATTTLPGLLSAADKIKLDGGQAQTVTVTVRNNTASAIGKGVPVYVTGSSGTTITIAPADASTEATAAETLGLTAASIAANADGTVIAVGELTGLNTSALAEGQIIWLGETTGGLTTTRPTQPAHGVVVGYCVKQAAGTAGIVYVKVDNGLELGELHDVLVTGATAGQFLQLAADGLWKPRTFIATDISNSTAAGRALLTAADAAVQRTSLGLGDLATANAATPPALGGTTPAAGSFTSLLSTTRLGLPSGAPASPAARDLYAVSDTLRYRDSSGTERLLLNATDNLSNLASKATARANLELGATDAPQFSRLGLGVAAATDLGLAVGGAVVQLRQTLTAVSGVYTIDVTTANEFIASAAIVGAVTINLSGLTSIPSGYVWRGVLRFAYTSGTITWFSGNTGYTVKWDGGSAITPTASEQEAVIIEAVGGGTVIEVAALRGRA